MAHLMFTRRVLNFVNPNACGRRNVKWQGIVKNGLCGPCLTQVNRWSSATDSALEQSAGESNADCDTFGVLDERFKEKPSTKSSTFDQRPPKTQKQRKASQFNAKRPVVSSHRAPERSVDRHGSNELGDDQKFAPSRTAPRNGEQHQSGARESRIRKVVIDKGCFSERELRNKRSPEDKFGSLAKEHSTLRESYDYSASDITSVVKRDKQLELETYWPHPQSRLLPDEYTKMIQDLLKERKLKEALELYHNRMIQQDRVQPTKRILTILINGCGQVGYVEMAFKLYKAMTDRGFVPTEAAYTGLFNACANSPFPEKALRVAHGLRNAMKEKGRTFNLIHYHVMMKAFGRCGDLATVFALADEMKNKRMRFTSETLSFMLVACAQDKDTGFRFAIQAWRKLRLQRIVADIYGYNLLLRTVRDCGIGKSVLANELLTPEPAFASSNAFPPPRPDLFPGDEEQEEKPSLEYLPDSAEESSSANLQISESYVQILTAEEGHMKQPVLKSPEEGEIPDLLSPDVSSSKVVALHSLDTAESRLQALGGPAGILIRMLKDGAKPNIKTFMLLLESSPSSAEAESQLIKMMDQHDVKPDIDFFNILIKKRNFRRDFENAKNVLEIIQERELMPDVVTFGVLALGCTYRKQADELLKCLEETSCRPNVEIMGALVTCGLVRKDWSYVISMLKVMKDENIKPSILLLRKVEKAINETKKIQVKEERGLEVHPRFKMEEYKEAFKKFRMFYSTWLKDMGLDYEDDPFKAYHPDIVEGDEPEAESKTVTKVNIASK